jgi:UDP-N-acetylglucosamine 2-epimerase (non-hydrolysing)
MRICVAAGTRPEAIKLAPVHKAVQARPGWRSIWIASGQHGEMKDRALAALDVVPDVRLEAPEDAGSLAERLAHMIAEYDRALAALNPDMVLVQGDTSTTIAAALAAFTRQIPVGHVEAGLRTFDLGAPFPEEGWRCLVGRLAALHFAPTGRSAANLRREAIDPARIHITGNTVIDALKSLPAEPGALGLPAQGRRRVVVTLHRRENWDGGVDRVIAALLALRDRFADVDVVFVAHANPALSTRVRTRLEGERSVTVCDPLDYPEFVALMRTAVLMLSDSGGVQEEAPAFGVPVLVLRDTTERAEAIEAGVARLVGTDTAAIVEAAAHLLSDAEAWNAMARASNPFGDGRAAGKIVDAIAAWARDRGLGRADPPDAAASVSA